MFWLNFPFTSFVDNTWLAGCHLICKMSLTQGGSECQVLFGFLYQKMEFAGLLFHLSIAMQHIVFSRSRYTDRMCNTRSIRINTFEREVWGRRIRQKKSVCMAGSVSSTSSSGEPVVHKNCCSLSWNGWVLYFSVNNPVALGCPRKTGLLGKRLSVTLKRSPLGSCLLPSGSKPSIERGSISLCLPQTLKHSDWFKTTVTFLLMRLQFGEDWAITVEEETPCVISKHMDT